MYINVNLRASTVISRNSFEVFDVVVRRVDKLVWLESSHVPGWVYSFEEGPIFVVRDQLSIREIPRMRFDAAMTFVR